MWPRLPALCAVGHRASVLRSHRWRTAENSAGYLADGWRHWARQDGGWFAVLNAEILCAIT